MFGAIIIKLSKDLVVFGAASLKSFFGIGKAVKDIKDLETSIKSALSSNVDLQQKILNLGNDRYNQMKLITAEIKNQQIAQRTLQKISSDLSTPAYKMGVRGTNQGLVVNPPKASAAGGYIPAVAQERKSIQKGVGGAKSGDKPVNIPNFNFGRGKKGSIVAHTGEYIVPNFGGGSGSAIFNRDMVRKMGLPEGAKKINAAGGFIPNFVEKYNKTRTLEEARTYWKKAKKETAIAAFENPNTSENDLIGASETLAKAKSLTYDFDASKFQFGNGMGIGLVALQNEAAGTMGRGRLTSDTSNIQDKLNAIGVPNLSKVLESKFRERNLNPNLFQGVKADVLTAKPNIAFENIKIGSVNALRGQYASDTFKDFQQTVNQLFARPIADLGNMMFGRALGTVQSGKVEDKYIFGKDILGGIFESATQFYIKGVDSLPSFQDGESNRNQRFDFPMANKEEAERLNSLFFKNGGVGIAEAKLTANASTLNSVVTKGLDNPEVINQMKKQIVAKNMLSKAEGFIPNFVSQSSLMGEGVFGKFYKLKGDVGVKRFKTKTDRGEPRTNVDNDITEEYAVGKLLAENSLIPGITAPKIFGTLEESLRRKSIRKQIISDKLAKNAIGGGESYAFGGIMSELLSGKGLHMDYLHGANYTINSAGENAVKQDNSYLSFWSEDRYTAKNKSFMQNFSSKGGIANIIDAGFATVSYPNLEAKLQQYATTSSQMKTAANGFIPNFVDPKTELSKLIYQFVDSGRRFPEVPGMDI